MEMNCFTCKYGGEEIEDCFTLVGNCTEDFNKWQPKEKMAEIKRRSEEGRLAYLDGYTAGYKKGLEKSLEILTDHRKMMINPPMMALCAKCGKDLSGAFEGDIPTWAKEV